MIALTLFLTALAAFSVGFICGMKAVPSPGSSRIPAEKADDGSFERLRREFSNFMSYDGTVQDEIRIGKDE